MSTQTNFAANSAALAAAVAPAAAPAFVPIQEPIPNDPKNETLEAKLERWFLLSRQAAELKKTEAVLRKEIFDEVFPEPERGTNRKAIGYGKDLKAVYKFNMTIDKVAMNEHAPNIPAELFHKVVKFDPRIQDGPWYEMTVDERKLFGEFVTQKPGLPELEIVNTTTRGKRK